MMYTTLYQYLLQHKELPVPGIGTFLLERKPAEVDFPNKKMNPPAYTIALKQASHLPEKGFFYWLAQTLHITDREAVFRFNDFAFELKKQLMDGDSITWHQVGTLSKGLSSDVKFFPANEVSGEKPITAEKVIREKAEHMVRVGEDQKTSAEMMEMLNQPGQKKSYWWAYALALILLSLVFIGWYLSEHGVDISSAANGKLLTPGQSEATYRLLP